MIGCAVIAGVAAEARSDNCIESPAWNIARQRQKLSLFFLGLFAFFFATGWAIPNPNKPVTIKSLYENCMWNVERKPENMETCLKVAQTQFGAMKR